jgi:hypothetical protein
MDYAWQGRQYGETVNAMPEESAATPALVRRFRLKTDLTVILAVAAFGVSVLNFYRNFIYTKQSLDVTVTEVSYVTNQGELYMTVAFANSGNREAALLRLEPALWSRHGKPSPEWVALVQRVDSNIPVTVPKTPTVIRAGGVEVVTLSAKLDAGDAEEAVLAPQGGAFLGIRVATMNSDGNLYLLQHPVARLILAPDGRIQSAEPTIHQTLRGFTDVDAAPPGDRLQTNKKTPFVWAESHY